MTPLAGTSVRDALDSALVALNAAGVDSPRLDAELLLAHALGVDRARLIIDRDTLSVAGPAAREFQSLVRRRAVEREPVAYLLGRKGFRNIELEVDSRVLIPRPETEVLVEAALRLPAGARVVDVGTGSGAVALALADERPDLDITATDISEDALDVARANARRLGLSVNFVRSDLYEGAFDAVVSNPPYVADTDELPPEIARHEPPTALYAGADGLAIIRRLVERDPDFLALEVGQGQAPAVMELAARYTRVEALPDLAGIERVVVACR